jgi:hypothetical protein
VPLVRRKREVYLKKLVNSILRREKPKTELEKFLKDDKPNLQFWNEVLAEVKTGP